MLLALHFVNISIAVAIIINEIIKYLKYEQKLKFSYLKVFRYYNISLLMVAMTIEAFE